MTAELWTEAEFSRVQMTIEGSFVDPVEISIELRRERAREAARRYRERYPDRVKELNRGYYHKGDKAKIRANRRRRVLRKHGISQERFDALLEAQGGLCAICSDSPSISLHIDHDHRCCPGDTSCGKCVRGLICGQCNVALGMAKDDPDRLLAMAEYLNAHR